MANRTVKDAEAIHGTNPQYLIEKIIRSRIYDCRYWKEECFALSAELLVDKGMELKFIGGVFGGNIKPTPFLCLVLKMLQIQPEKDIIVEFIKNEDFKYVRALGAYYLRLTGTSLDCFKYLEPLYNDYRKLKRQTRDGAFQLVHMDEFIDELLHEERMCDIILPRIQKRHVLEEGNKLEQRVSALEDDLDDVEESEEEIEMVNIHSSTDHHRDHHSSRNKPRKSPSPIRKRRNRSKSPSHKRRHRSRSREKERRKHKSSRDHDRKKNRSRSRSPRDRHKKSSHKHSRHGSRKDRSSRERDTNRGRDEIAEANAVRAKLGLAPLRP
ncbi:Pre-mRNA-splicing factor 38A [Nymphon striatum]|nr:Pre-mRNA-splicing factor 38A [Nymphon striatum]